MRALGRARRVRPRTFFRFVASASSTVAKRPHMTRYAPVLSSTSPRHLVSQYPTQPSFHTAPASPSSTSTDTSRPIKGSASGSYARLGIATSSAGAPRALRRALDAPDVQRR